MFLALSARAQNETLGVQAAHKRTLLKRSILPMAFLTGGILISSSTSEKTIQRKIRNAVGNDFSTTIDNYTRYAPIVQLYAADVLGVKAKNHWFDQTKNLTLAIIITDFITFKLKNSIHKTRPNESDVQSFPSAHTSFAFANATVVYEEFKDSSPMLAYSGYGFATATGILRTMNNAHFISDVLVGAGIGILVSEVIYYFDPIIRWNPFKKINNVTLLPQIDNNQKGLYLCIQL